MSQLQKRIQRIQRREGPAIGFGRVTREQPRAMALIAAVRNRAGAEQALEAGADAVMIVADEAAAAARELDGVASEKVAVGVRVPSLSAAQAEALLAAHCDFVVSPMDATDSIAVDTEKMGQVVLASAELDDNILRALGPLGFDGLFIESSGGSMTLGQQLALVRIATFASTGLLVSVPANAPAAELRVLRDSGALAVVAPEGTSSDSLKALVEALKAVPAPRKGRREGNEMAIVPSAKVVAGDEDEGEEEDE
jgi:2-keto-3-deoxy-L-rhamnonate aldolase RhmA